MKKLIVVLAGVARARVSGHRRRRPWPRAARPPRLPARSARPPRSPPPSTPAAPAPSGSWSRRSRPATRTPTSTSSPRAATPSPRSARSATGGNNGGQTIVRLTQGGAVDPEFLAGHRVGELPLESRRRDRPPARRRGDAEGRRAAQLGQPVRGPVRHPAPHRRHRRARPLPRPGPAGPRGRPAGRPRDHRRDRPGARRRRSASISHIGESHTVNVDPKRPHIAYSVTSDSVGVDEDGTRSNESGSGLNLDGFEVVDISSCMNFPAGTTLDQKRAQCRPRGVPLPLPERAVRAGPHAEGHHLRLPRARGLPRRPAHVRAAGPRWSAST